MSLERGLPFSSLGPSRLSAEKRSPWPKGGMGIGLKNVPPQLHSILTFVLCCRDLFGQMKFILALVLTFVIWISSIIIVVPYVLSLDYNYINKTCDELWSTDGSRQGYTISLFLLDYALPLIALLVMYVMVWGRMQR